MLEYPQRFARNIPNSNSASSGNSTVSQQQYPPQLPLHQNQNYRQLATTSSAGSGPGSPVHHQRQSSLLQQQQHHRTLSTASSCSAQHKSVTFGQPALSAPQADYSNNGSSSGNSSNCSAAGGNAAGPQSMAGNMKHGKIHTHTPRHASSLHDSLCLLFQENLKKTSATW